MGNGSSSRPSGSSEGRGPSGAAAILIVDDDPAARRILTERLGAEGFRIEHADDPGELVERLAMTRVDLVLLNERLDGSSCWELLDPIRSKDPALPVILLFDREPMMPDRVQADRLGVLEVLAKGGDVNRLLKAVRKGLGAGRGHGDEVETPPLIIGESEAMRRVRMQISRIAPSPSRVLISGESGTGKELAARWIHHLSPRASEPFVPLNCSAFPSELFEAELFGHEKGAFTGAIQRRIGKLEAAAGGTLFLDEIAELHPSAQAKLLRALQENRFSRVGGNDIIHLRARVLAATNAPLHRLVHEGSFRLDLFHRIAVIPVTLPPLRDHPEDIPMLVDFMLRRLQGLDARFQATVFSPSAIETLQELQWPGNVRELFNMVERIAVMSDHPMILREDVMHDLSNQPQALWFPRTPPPPESTEPAGSGLEHIFAKSATFEQFREASERWFLDQRLREHRWNISRTADAIGMPRSLLYTKIRKHGLQRG